MSVAAPQSLTDPVALVDAMVAAVNVPLPPLFVSAYAQAFETRASATAEVTDESTTANAALAAHAQDVTGAAEAGLTLYRASFVPVSNEAHETGWAFVVTHEPTVPGNRAPREGHDPWQEANVTTHPADVFPAVAGPDSTIGRAGVTSFVLVTSRERGVWRTIDEPLLHVASRQYAACDTVGLLNVPALYTLQPGWVMCGGYYYQAQWLLHDGGRRGDP